MILNNNLGGMDLLIMSNVACMDQVGHMTTVHCIYHCTMVTQLCGLYTPLAEWVNGRRRGEA